MRWTQEIVLPLPSLRLQRATAALLGVSLALMAASVVAAEGGLVHASWRPAVSWAFVGMALIMTGEVRRLWMGRSDWVGILLVGAPALFMGLLIASLNLGWIRVV